MLVNMHYANLLCKAVFFCDVRVSDPVANMSSGANVADPEFDV